MTPAARKPNLKPGYKLGYFTLWWSRMVRDGVKDELARSVRIIVIHPVHIVTDELLYDCLMR